MDASTHILVIDDHRDIRDPLAKYLAGKGYRTTTAPSAAEARRILETHAIDLVVLDVMMPGEDGLSLCGSIRAKMDIPVILLTAMAEETDRIIGLEVGADDYVVKPFSTRELLARIKAVLRRANNLPMREKQLPNKIFQFDRWRLDVPRRELIAEDGLSVPLSTSEFRLLTAFLSHPGMVLSRDQLLVLTRQRTREDVFDRSIDNQVSRLRRKIEADLGNPTLIKTVWGGGYICTPDATPQ